MAHWWRRVNAEAGERKADWLVRATANLTLLVAPPAATMAPTLGAPMHRSPLLLLILCGACSDYNFHQDKKDDNPGIFDSGHTTVDTADTSTTPGDTSVSNDVCEGESYPGGEVALNEECYIEYTVGTFSPVVEWKKSSWSVDPSSNNIMMTPAVASLTDDNGDGLINSEDTPDIIVVTYGSYGTLRAVSGDGSSEIFNITGQQLQGQGAVALGDIDNDGIVEIIACTSSTVKAFEHDGTLKWTSPSIAGHLYGTSDAPAIADMDGDGNPEIIVGNAILNNDGSIRGLGSYGRGGSANVGTTSFAVDLDADGDQELISGNAIYDVNGTAIWHNSEQDGYVAVADFDGDGQGEIIAMNSGKIWLTDTDGTVLWRNTVSGASSGYGGPPTIADYDGDGEPEVGVAGRSNYTVFDTDGTKMWEKTTQDASSGNTGSAVFDFEGDGVAEAVYADETRLWVFNGPDGAVKLESTEHSNGTWTEYSVIADVDGDGHAEIVVPNTSPHTGFYVFGDASNSWREGRRIWNQHAYSITNVDDDGGIPTSPDLNWLKYNNFRSGDLGAGQDGEYPDLLATVLDVCLDDCDEGKLTVWYQVGNRGYYDINEPVLVEVYGLSGTDRELLESVLVTDPMLSGRTLDASSIEVDLSLYPDVVFDDILVTIDGGNASSASHFAECDETNNEDEWNENLCP